MRTLNTGGQPSATLFVSALPEKGKWIFSPQGGEF
jgi:hypothetical protein